MDRIKDLSLSELSETLNQYPWFAGARMEMARRTGQWEDAALYVPDRRFMFYLSEGREQTAASGEIIRQMFEAYRENKKEKNVRVVGGDYFSQAQYNEVSRDEDAGVKAPAVVSIQAPEYRELGSDLEFYTESLAQVYVEQGYLAEAKDIYSKLILRYPEKNAYFAALIRKLEEEI